MYASLLLLRIIVPMACKYSFVAGFILTSICLCQSAKADGLAPDTLVTEFHDTLLSTMKEAQQLGIEGRFQRLKPSISKTFHLRAMIQAASAAYWRKSSEEEQNRLVEAFSRLTFATYAAQFDGYSGQKFVTVGTKPGPRKSILVETTLEDPNGKGVKLVYVARVIKGNWRIIDVLLDTGISELARKISEYRQVLKSGGIAGLIKTLEAKTSFLLSP